MISKGLSVGLVVAGGVSISLLAVPVGVLAFAPESWHELYGAIGKSHESQTIDALRQLIAEVYKTSAPSRSSLRALDEIAAADAKVDTGRTKDLGAYHFDGERFAEAQKVIADSVKDVVYGLKNQRLEGARFKLGSSLHTLQDFYSHSNWIEQMNTTPHPAVGREVPIQNTALEADKTCVECLIINVGCTDCSANLNTTKLTSGYYGGQPDAVRPHEDKCDHGGVKDSTAHGGGVINNDSGINKDTLICGLSPHHFLHEKAAAVATAATKQFVLDLKAKVTDVEFMQLLGIGPSLAAVVDTSGSMEMVWKALADHVNKLIWARVKTPDQISKLVYVPFSDPFVGSALVTTDSEEFITTLRNTKVSKGDDCPEMSMKGLERAIAASDPGGAVFLLTDAEAKDPEKASAVAATARARGIEVYPIVLGSCSGAEQSTPGFAAAANIYDRLASETGGTQFSVSKEMVGQVLELIDERTRGGHTALAKAVRLKEGDFKNKAIGGPLPIVVDGTMTRLTVVATKTSEVQLIRPNGAAVASTDPGVQVTLLEHGAIYRVTSPEVGVWNVHNTIADAVISVSADATLGLVSARFVESSGQGTHDGYFPIHGQPLAEKPQKMQVRLDGSVSRAQLELRDERGEVLVTAPLTVSPHEPGTYLGDVVPPSLPYVVYVTGTTAEGHAFQRSSQRVDHAQHLHVAAPQGVEAVRGQKLDYTFSLRNAGPSDSFAVEVQDDNGFVTTPLRQVVDIGADQTVQLTVALQVGDKADFGIVDHLSLSAASKRDPTLTTSGVVDTYVSQRADADLDGVEDAFDNCPQAPNPTQADTDADKMGDACDDELAKKSDDGCSSRAPGSARTGVLALFMLAVAAQLSRRRRARQLRR